MLAKRILTGIIGGAFTIFVVYEGNWLFFLMMALLASSLGMNTATWSASCRSLQPIRAEHMALGHAERLLVRQYETDVSLGTGSLMLAHAADGLFPRQGKARRQCLCPVWPLIHRQRIFSLIGPAKRVCRLLYERPLQHGMVEPARFFVFC